MGEGFPVGPPELIKGPFRLTSTRSIGRNPPSRAARSPAGKNRYLPLSACPTRPFIASGCPMKVRNSLKSLRGRHRANRLVRRKGRVYVINKVQRRFKARQGYG